jgi:hypothetical protein
MVSALQCRVREFRSLGSIRQIHTYCTFVSRKIAAKFESLFSLRSLQERAYMYTDKIRPHHQREDALPETQVKVADGEEPGGDPHAPEEGVLFDPDPGRKILATSFCFHGLPSVHDDSKSVTDRIRLL